MAEEAPVQLRRLEWIGSAKKDLQALPAEVMNVFGYALYLAQTGRKHDQAKALRGFGSAGVLENAPRSWQMSKRKIIDGTQIHEGSANVYRDLGYADADEMLVKAQLVAKIGEIIRGRELTQVAAARTLGITQPKLSGLLRGQFHGISERKLIACLTSLGRDVQIVVKSAPRRGAAGKLSVVFA
jgi:predicted XRE-type DNA-binding protein